MIAGKIFRSFIAAIAGICIVAGIAMLSLPALLSTKIFRDKTLALFNEQIPGKIKIDHLSLNWFGSQHIEGFALSDSNGDSVLNFKSLQTETSLAALLLKGISGNLDIHSLNVNIKDTPNGKTNLEDSLGKGIACLRLPRLAPFAISETNLELDYSLSGKAPLKIKAQGEANQGNITGKFLVDILWSDSKDRWHAEFVHFPTRILDSFLAMEHPELAGLLPKLIGESLNIELKEIPGGDGRSWKIGAFSQQIILALNITASENSGMLTAKSEGTYYYKNSPVKYRLETDFDKPKNFQALFPALSTPSQIQFTAEQIPSILIEEVLDAKGAIVNAFGNSVSINLFASNDKPETIHVSLMSERLNIPKLSLSIDQNILQKTSKNLSGTLDFEHLAFKGNGKIPAVNSLTVPWQIRRNQDGIALNFTGAALFNDETEGNFTGALTIQSFESLARAHFSCNMKGERIPAAFFELFTGFNGFEPLFGHSFNMDLSVNIEKLKGTIKADLSGSRGSCVLNAHAVNGILYLNDPFILTTLPTKELGQKVLQRFSPVFQNMLDSEGTIKFRVDPKHFSMPIHPFDIANISIESAVLDAGKLLFSNSGDIQDLLNVLRPAKSDKISVWTTPLHVSLHDGILHVKRVDMLIMNRYPIASWGKIDLEKDKVNMIIGLSGTALSQAFDLPNIDKNTFVQIPVKGSISKAKIDSSKTARKIGALVAQNSGRPEGIVIGTVLALANGKEEKVPPQTTNPLPWEKSLPKGH